MDWSDDDLIMVSAIQHYSYCPRQWALIHREQTFNENIYTLRGRMVHETVDEERERIHEGHKVVTSLRIWSDDLGLIGVCDVVEFHGTKPYPVEYKHGRRKPQVHDELQLCAQAICLEEMFQEAVPRGLSTIFHPDTDVK